VGEDEKDTSDSGNNPNHNIYCNGAGLVNSNLSDGLLSARRISSLYGI
jgi:hypothetical protein